MALLKTEGLGIQFGGLKAVDEFNFEIDKNQLFGLIGPNGAGKTTLLRM
ncbi:MAG: ATP-binding cassette domain-containing protein, partial [Coprobacillus sp.]|nr:ATP-binding cassette domain-containing protein [Coprobacillus sp.]